MEAVQTKWHVAQPKWHLRPELSDIQLEDGCTAVKSPLFV